MKLEGVQLVNFRSHLVEEEKSSVTVEKYIRDIQKLYQFLDGREEIDKTSVILFKEHLIRTYKTASVNSMLAAVNRFLGFLGHSDWKVKRLKVQRKPYCAEEKELSKSEYKKLIQAAIRQKNTRLSLLMQTVCATGIRVSEISYITAEAVRRGEAEVCCKGKTRLIMIPRKLQLLLIQYMKKQGIQSGPLFITKNGNPLNRSNIWREMKKLCQVSGICPRKVFPHNLRHLFARTFYNLKKDLVRLADVLGHSQIETTRIYTISTGAEHKRQINALDLVL